MHKAHSCRPKHKKDSVAEGHLNMSSDCSLGKHVYVKEALLASLLFLLRTQEQDETNEETLH